MSRHQPILPGAPNSPSFVILLGGESTTSEQNEVADITIILKPGTAISMVRLTRRKTDSSGYLDLLINKTTTVTVK